MKNVLLTSLLIVFTSLISFGQNSSKIKVSGNCGMCKNNIETAAKAAGALTAAWDKNTKLLTVTYNASSTSTDKMETAIANAGYDSEKFKATEEQYNKLSKCCQYDREAATSTETDKTEKKENHEEHKH